jgi:hypothetical protein
MMCLAKWYSENHCVEPCSIVDLKAVPAEFGAEGSRVFHKAKLANDIGTKEWSHSSSIELLGFGLQHIN